MRSRLREALHHGVRRAFAVLASHYDVDLERVSEGYCLPDEDEAALAEVQRLDAAAKALAQAAEQKEVDRVAMSEAISAFCQVFGLEDVPSGSSP